jgi:hypothetical protein
MKYNYLSIFITCCLLFNLSTTKCQTFDWADTSFEIGNKREIYLYYDCDGPCTVIPCANFRENHLIYDTLSTFLSSNPNIKIEIEYYFSNKGSDRYSINYGKRKAKGIQNELLKLGFLKRQFNCIYTYDTISFSKQRKAFRKINVKIIGNELPTFVQELSKDTLAQKFYHQYDYFKIPIRDSIAWNTMGKYFKKVLEQDSTLSLEIEWIYKVGKYGVYNPPRYKRKITTYFIEEQGIKEEQLKDACILIYKEGKWYKDWRDSNYIVLKIVSKKAYIKCKKEKRKYLKNDSLCKNCPF